MKKMRFIVEVFDRYPEAHIGVLTARDIEVVHSDPDCKAPWMAADAPPSDCISTTSGTVPQMFRSPRADISSAY